MSRVSQQRQDRITELTREIGRSLATKTVLFHAALASRLGLSATDLKCLDLLRNATEPMTATDLVERTGLTGGAITGVVDRLEARGFVERVRDANDRRRWELHAVAASREAVIDLFGYLRGSVAELCEGFSDDELDLVADFLTKLGLAMDDASAQLRSGEGPGRG